MIEARKLTDTLVSILPVALAVASIIALPVLAQLLWFILATGAGSEHDLNDAMRGGGLVLAAMSGIVLAWVVYGLRGFLRIILALPFAAIFCFGILSAWAAGA